MARHFQLGLLFGLFAAAYAFRTGTYQAVNTVVPPSLSSCYTGTNYWPSVRLPNSLDNLIYIIEKIENAIINSGQYSSSSAVDASTMASAILRRFQINGIKDVKDRETKNVDTNEAEKQDIVFTILPNFSNGSIPENILTDREKCSLHFMVSSGVNTTAYTYQTQYDYSTLAFYPRENGAIYAGKYGTLSAGPLLAGIAAGAVTKSFTVVDLLYENEVEKVDQSFRNMVVDPIMGATLAGEIAQSTVLYAYPQYYHAVFGPNGVWNGTTCPTTLALESNETTAATKSELLGALDGMVIGYFLKTNYYSAGITARPLLSQVLRSYYGRGLQMSSVNACDRNNQQSQIANALSTSAIGFAAAYIAKGAKSSADQQFPSEASFLGSAITTSIGNFSTTYLQSNAFACDTSIQDLPCLTENDVIVVMDVSVVSSSSNFQEQKDFIGKLIQRMGVYPNGSHISVATFSSSNREPIPYMTSDQNGGDVRCQLQWSNTIYPGSIDAPNTIRFVQEKFRNIRNAQRNANLPKVPGKVVIFIYLQPTVQNANDVKNAMKELRRELPEVTALAVGTNKDTLRNFVFNDADVFLKPGEQISYTLDQIMKRLCTAPATLEYRDCRNPNQEAEKQLIGDSYIYPNTYQWIAISPYTFNLTESNDAYLNFESKYGSASFCVARTISYDAATTDCFDTSTTEPYKQYRVRSICNNDDYCPWLYISAKVRTSGSASEKCAERACDSWNQVKVSISHEGLKCGAVQIFAAIPILAIGLFLSWISRQY